jgi:hypothetical protein
MLVDRTSIDIFGNYGALYMPMCMVVPAADSSLSLAAREGTARIKSLNVFELKSAWT